MKAVKELLLSLGQSTNLIGLLSGSIVGVPSVLSAGHAGRHAERGRGSAGEQPRRRLVAGIASPSSGCCHGALPDGNRQCRAWGQARRFGPASQCRARMGQSCSSWCWRCS